MKKIASALGVLLLLCTLSACANASSSSHGEDSVSSGDHTEHSWGAWQTASQATCIDTGMDVRSCSLCSYTDTRMIEAEGHRFRDWTCTLAPTCTESGVEARTCSVCEDIDSRTVDPLGHSFGEWEITKAPLCEEKGVESRICSVCEGKVTKDLPEAGHVWEEQWVETLAPTCEDKGKSTLYCTLCDKTQDREIKPLGHTFSVTESKKETLAEDGYQILTCSSCKSTKKEFSYATGSLGIEFASRSDGTCVVTGIGAFGAAELVLPSEHGGQRVVSVAEDAFADCETLTSVVLSDSILSLGKSAFEGCVNLQSVALGASLTNIGESAFFGCEALTVLSRGDALVTIEKYAFWGCTALSSVTLGASLSTVGELAFFGCEALSELFYGGDVNSWVKITVASDNAVLVKVPRYYYAETEPSLTGKYWHYVDGMATKW